MKLVDPATQATFDDGRVIRRSAILFQFPSGNHGFWTGIGPEVWNTITFIGSGSLIEVSAVTENTKIAATQVTATLRAIPNTDLTPDRLATIESEDYAQRLVTIYDMFFAVDTRARLAVIVNWRGRVQRMLHQRDGKGSYLLSCEMESHALDYSKRGWNVRSVEMQAKITPSDKSARFAATAGRETIYWGMEPKN